MKIESKVGVNFDAHKTHSSRLVDEAYILFGFWGLSACMLFGVYWKIRYGNNGSNTPSAQGDKRV